jgi:murein DD-endopeptidase MepM/ murein hydrolase activator NlpD
MTGKFFRVDVTGSYLEPRSELQCGPPTSLALKTLGIVAGDFLALQASGSFSAGHDYPNQTGLGACFFAGAVPVLPGNFGQQDAIYTPPTWPKQIATDITNDFFVPLDRQIIVRVPATADRLVFSVPDSFFKDNTDPSGAFGVLISKPNKKSTFLVQTGVHLDELRDKSENDSEPLHSLRHVERLLPILVDWPIAKSYSKSPTHTEDGAHGAPQYRGWYLKSGWNPSNSVFNLTGSSSRKHFGIDIFAPNGTRLIVPVGPCRVDLLPNVKGYGNTVAFRFIKDKEKYTCIYGHCESFIFNTGRLANLGEEVAKAGCSGNSSAENCGLQLPGGGRTDHVHVGVYKGLVISDSASPVNPLVILGWTPIIPT